MTILFKDLQLGDEVEYRKVYDKTWERAVVTTLSTYRNAGGGTSYSVGVTVGEKAPETGWLATVPADKDGYVRQVQRPQPTYACGTLVEYLCATGKWLKGKILGYQTTARGVSYEVSKISEGNAISWMEGSKLRPRNWAPKFAPGDYVDVEFKTHEPKWCPDYPRWAYGHPSLTEDQYISTWEAGRVLKVDKLTEMYTILNLKYNNQMFASETEMRKTEEPKTIKDLEAENRALKAENEKLKTQLEAVRKAVK